MLDSDPDSNNDHDDVGFLGGVLRGILRSVGYLTRIKSIGRLPQRIPRKIVSKSADRLGQLHENYQLVKEAYDRARKTHPGSRIKSLLQTALLSSHGMVKSAILGGFLFSVYESAIDEFENMHLYSTAFDSNSLPQYVLLPGVYAGCAGALAGSIHGMLFSIWDRSITVIPDKWWKVLHIQSPTPFTRSFTVGTAISHSLVHASLFASYECSKRGSLHVLGLRHRDEHLSRLEGGMCVLIGGMVAGIVSDAVGSGTRVFEEWGLRGALRQSRAAVAPMAEAVTVPNLRSICRTARSSVGSAIPTALGFLAFEYAKEHAATSE